MEPLEKTAAVATSSDAYSEKHQLVHFKDPRGRKFMFPYHLCNTWEGMKDQIQQALLHDDVFRPKAAQGYYDLAGPNKEIILPDAWETIIKPGWEVTMYMWPDVKSKDILEKAEEKFNSTKSTTKSRSSKLRIDEALPQAHPGERDIIHLDHHDRSTVVYWPKGSILKGDISVGNIRNHIIDTFRRQDQQVELIFEKQLLLNDIAKAVDVGIKSGSRITYVIEEADQESEPSEDEAALPYDLSVVKRRDSGKHKLRNVASECLNCDNQFKNVVSNLRQAANSIGIAPEQIQDEFDRFRIWLGTTSARQPATSRMSLDRSLGDASNLKREFLALLGQLSVALNDISEIATGRRQNRSKTVSTDDESLMTIAESEELLKLISSTISSLFRMSLLVKKAAPRDNFIKANTAVKKPIDPTYDIQHVAAKLPRLKKEPNERLLDKLGNAITQRRQYFRYSRKHHEQRSYSAYKDGIVNRWTDLPNHANAKKSSVTLNRQTENRFTSTLTSALQPDQLIATQLSGAEQEDDTISRISSATSLLGAENGDCLRVPLLERVSHGSTEFECPFCYTMISPKSQKHWKKHVFTDLRPYVCQYIDCDVQLFSDRQAWFNHELLAHRSTHKCLFCAHQPFTSKDALELHLTKQHSNFCLPSGIDSLVKACTQIPQSFSSTACILCYEWAEEVHGQNPHIPKSEDVFVTAEQLCNHMALHMEQLALFALPKHLVNFSYDSVIPHNVTESNKIMPSSIFGQRRSSSLSHKDYTIGWICHTGVELAAATVMLDERHSYLQNPEDDSNHYEYGSIFSHNIVIMAGSHGDFSSMVTPFRRTFPHTKFILFVGLGGGVPTQTDAGHIRLGDVVVGMPGAEHSGVVRYGSVQADKGRFGRIGFNALPPTYLIRAVRQLAAFRIESDIDPLQAHLQRVDDFSRSQPPSFQKAGFVFPGTDEDYLYDPEYVHIDTNRSCQECGCSATERVIRGTRNNEHDTNGSKGGGQRLTVHQGTIASIDRVIPNGRLRDRLASKDHVLCFDKEWMGAYGNFPCLVIRGISDYSDSHINERWQGYASLNAAAYARELLSLLSVEQVKRMKITESLEKRHSDNIDGNFDPEEGLYQDDLGCWRDNETASPQIPSYHYSDPRFLAAMAAVIGARGVDET